MGAETRPILSSRAKREAEVLLAVLTKQRIRARL